MAHPVKLAFRIFLVMVSVVSLLACGSGGGGGGGGGPIPDPVLSLTGTVSDSTQAPVSGAVVTLYNTAGTPIDQTTTNAVGRYSFQDLGTGAERTIKVTGPSGNFPAMAEKITLADAATVLDFYLPSSAPASVAPAISATTWQSPTQIDGPRRAYLELAAAPASTPTVTLAPVDVSKIGDGFPTYSVSPLVLGVDEILEVYAAAAFSFSGPALTGATLHLPVPPALDTAAAAAVAPVLYRFDETTAAWVAQVAVPVYVVDPTLGNFFAAAVSQPGYYRVAKPVPAQPVTGTLVYSDGTTPAAGVTVHATGSDYGYQQAVVTNAQGQFTALVKTGGATSYTFTAWGFGVELRQSSATPSATLGFAKPVVKVPASASLTLDDPGILPNSGVDSIGLIVASGRLNSEVKVIDGTTLTPARADVAFNVNSFDGSLSLNATTKGSGIQVVAGSTFETLTTAPASGYADQSTFAAIPIPTTLPAGGLLVAVKTSAGFAKIAIDSVTETPAASGNWVIKFRSTFSLTGTF